jgi:anti-anti-sigma factor
MSILSTRDADVLIVTPDGYLDTETSPEADRIITAAVDRGETRVLVDFVNTAYVSSAGLRVLLKANRSLQTSGGAFGLCNANEHIRKVLEISGFASLIPSYASLEEAKRSLAEKPKVA